MVEKILGTKGRLNKSQLDFINSHLDSMSDDDIAKVVGKSPDLIKRMRARQPAVYAAAIEDSKDLEYELETKPFWPELQKQLTREEMGFFKRSWIVLINQFKEHGVKATDDMMIRDLIMLEVDLNRNRIAEMRIRNDKEAAERAVEDEMKLPLATRNVDRITSLNNQIVAFIGALDAMSKERNTVLQRKDVKFKDLKATRLERLKHVEEAKSNIFELIEELTTAQKRKVEGRRNCLCNMCAQKERERLSQTIQYEASGEFDIPFLTPEVVLDDEVVQTMEGEESQSSQDTVDSSGEGPSCSLTERDACSCQGA